MNYIITIADYLMGRSKFEDLEKDKQADIPDLLDKVNRLRMDYERSTGRVAGKCSSGYRRLLDHIRVYRDKGITDMDKIPMGSQHLKGQAIDIFDADGMFDLWIDMNPEKLIEYDLYREGSAHTKGWCHLQLCPPKSRKRTFSI